MRVGLSWAEGRILRTYIYIYIYIYIRVNKSIPPVI